MLWVFQCWCLVLIIYIDRFLDFVTPIHCLLLFSQQDSVNYFSLYSWLSLSLSEFINYSVLCTGPDPDAGLGGGRDLPTKGETVRKVWKITLQLANSARIFELLALLQTTSTLYKNVKNT